MEPGKIAKQMIDFQKTTFDNTFNAMVSLQEQTEKMVNTIIGQAPWLPEEGKKVINEWVGAYKKGRNDFKKLVDQNFKKVEEAFASPSKPKTTSKKTK
jgi:polyhydroxyalkanoate synthesis regulator phasin